MAQPVDAIEVRIWGMRVGAVALDPPLGHYAFEYEPAFAARGIELAPLMMPTTRGRASFIFPALPENTYRRLPPMLADALPDRFGNALVDAYLQREGVRAVDITALDRLAYMGQRSFGALEFRPLRGPRARKSVALDMSELVTSARLAVHGSFDGDAHAKAALANIIQVGTSAGGARAKAAIAWNPASGEVCTGQFDVEPGFEHWLLKFDGVGNDSELGDSQHYGRIEYAYHRMAVAAGIDMSACRLLEENRRAHFMTRRFDRTGNVKHHLQSLCAIAHLDFNQRGTHDYSQYLMTIDALRLGDAARQEAFRRIAFNVMAANCDDHTKNHAFLLEQGKPWALTPAYDLTHAFNPRGQWTYQHLMSVEGKFIGITRADLLRVADRFRVPSAKASLDAVREAVRDWPRFGKEAGLPAADIRRIEEDLTPL